MVINQFPAGVTEKIGFYVYLLTHPETKEIFYVGKGRYNRIFAHVGDALTGSTPSDKLQVIRSIHENGLEVGHMILRHGLTEKEALEVEAALIDFVGLPNLTNLVEGHGVRSRSKMSVVDIVAQYAAKPVNIMEHGLMLILNSLYRPAMSEADLYEITRGKWVLGERRNKARYAFAVYRGVIRQVYSIQSWSRVNTGNAKQKIQDRWMFEGAIAEDLAHYLGGSVEHYLKPGSQNPARYVNCHS